MVLENSETHNFYLYSTNASQGRENPGPIARGKTRFFLASEMEVSVGFPVNKLISLSSLFND